MGLEIGTYIEDLDPNNPEGSDNINQGDDHIRLVKEVLQNQFPNLGQNAMAVQADSLNALIGMVGAFAAAPGGGWLLCDGGAVSRSEYPVLFAQLGVTYGNGDGSTTFNLPDYRGEFLRGVDSGAGNDPDAGSRTDRGDGATGDQVGTKQADEFRAHNHPNGADTAAGTISSGATIGQLSVNTGNRGGAETRPRNVGVLYYILGR